MPVRFGELSTQEEIARGPTKLAPTPPTYEESLLGSAWIESDPALAFIDSMQYRVNTEEQVGFNAIETLPSKYLPYIDAFYGLKSEEESLAKQRQIDAEIKRQEQLAEAGLAGVAAYLFTGMVGPASTPALLLGGWLSVGRNIAQASKLAKISRLTATETAITGGLKARCTVSKKRELWKIRC